MTDEKKIELMAKVLHDRIVNKTWRANKVAKELYKIAVPEGAVVLTSNQKISIEHEWYRLGYEQARKETARKFLNMIYWKAVKHIKGKSEDECFIEISFEKLDEIAKECGVDIEV